MTEVTSFSDKLIACVTGPASSGHTKAQDGTPLVKGSGGHRSPAE